MNTKAVNIASIDIIVDLMYKYSINMYILALLNIILIDYYFGLNKLKKHDFE